MQHAMAVRADDREICPRVKHSRPSLELPEWREMMRLDVALANVTVVPLEIE